MTTAVLSFGSNLGDSAQIIHSAIGALGSRITARSSLYRTAPWGDVPQNDFLNATVIASDPTWIAADWLKFAVQQETSAHRERDIRWGPRTLDIDVINVDADGTPIISADPTLTLPHPRAHQRAFVLIPWLAIDADAAIPGHGLVRDIVKTLPPSDIAGVTAWDDAHA